MWEILRRSYKEIMIIMIMNNDDDDNNNHQNVKILDNMPV